MNIHYQMQKFAELDNALIGRGFKHPSFPRLELQTTTTNFIAEYPFLQQDQAYIDFLEFYAGASFDYPNGDYLDIFGFLDEIGLHLILDENPAIDDD